MYIDQNIYLDKATEYSVYIIRYEKKNVVSFFISFNHSPTYLLTSKQENVSEYI